jgi:hypothetical protein
MSTISIYEEGYGDRTDSAEFGSTYQYVPLVVPGRTVRRVVANGIEIYHPYKVFVERGIVTIDMYLVPLPPPPPPPPPPPIIAPIGGEIVYGSVGVSCTMYTQGTNGNFYYQVRDRDDNPVTSYGKDWESANEKGRNDPRCQLPKYPPPKTIGEVSAEIERVNGLLSDLRREFDQSVGGIGSALQALQDTLTSSLADLWERIDTLSQKISDEAAAWREQVSGLRTQISTDISGVDARWRAGVAEIWASLDAWLVERIVDILLEALNTAARDYQRGK